MQLADDKGGPVCCFFDIVTLIWLQNAAAETGNELIQCHRLLTERSEYFPIGIISIFIIFYSTKWTSHNHSLNWAF